MRWTLTLTQRRRAETFIVGVTGRLAAAAAPRLAGVIADAIAAGERDIVLDLQELAYISSAGILALEAAAARLRMEGGRLQLAGPPPQVRLALELAGFPDDVSIL